MKLSLRLILASLFILLINLEGKTQILEAGINAGMVANRYTVSRNNIRQNLLVRQGDLDFSPRIGAQLALKGNPDKYKAYVSPMQHGLMAEVSACKCGGNTELVIKNPDNSQSFADLEYVTWQADFSLLYIAKFSNTRFMIGPSVTYHTYRAVRDSRFVPSSFVYPQGQINQFYAGIDFGVGYRVEDFLLTARYHTNVTAYGKETNKVNATYGIHQARLVVSYFLFEKRVRRMFRGLYF